MAAKPLKQDLIRELFDRALERPAGERGAFVEQACRGNVDLQAELDSLLALHEEAGGALRDPSGAVSEEPGERIGAYKLLQRIGEGGFGTVWMAEQEEPVRRKVALKVLKAGMDTAQVVARFEAERQALALMEHPNIAQVFEAGATARGRPYFVMELVRGVPITQYCDEARLAPRERMELFVPVCQAVQHAHYKGVIHRDIKPSNVLVTLHDGEPVPKVIDFGIAKATQGRLTERTLFTGFRQMLGTPEYMAPEQAELSGLDVDTRADVYSLGVLLYELLTGTQPFDFKRLLAAGYAEMLHTIKEVEPQKPSTRVSTLGNQLASIARQRRMHPRALGPLMRGDLDWIVMRTLEKERNRRYATPAELAADLRRYLRSEPVEAGPPSALYKLRKYVQRHRVGVGAGAAIALSVVAGGAAAGWGWVRARKEAHISRVEATKAATLVGMLEKMLASSNPKHFHGPDYTVRQLLEDSEPELARELVNEPEVEVELRRILAKTFLALGLQERAAAQAARVRELLESLPGGTATLDDRVIEAHLLSEDSRHAEALSLLEALDARLREPGQPDDVVSRARNIERTCQINLGRLEEARQTSLETLARQREKGNDDGVLHAMLDLADVEAFSGRLAAADAIFREVALLLERAEPFPCLRVHYQLGHASVLKALMRMDEALDLAEQGLARSRELYGDSGVDTAYALRILSRMLVAMEDLAAAADKVEEAWKLYVAIRGETHVDTVGCLMDLAEATADPEAALGYARQALEIHRAAGRENTVIDAEHRTTLARILVDQGRLPEAEEAVRAALVTFRSLLDEQDPRMFQAKFTLARIAQERGDLYEAERLFRELLPLLEGNVERYVEGLRELGRVLLAKGAPQEAVACFESCLAELRRVEAPASATEAWVLHDLADARWVLGERDEARRLNDDCRSMFAAVAGPDFLPIAEAAECLAKKLIDTSDPEGATGLLQEAVRIRITAGQLTKSADNRHRLGHLLLKREDRTDADEQFRAALEELAAAGEKESHLGAELCIHLGQRRTAEENHADAARLFREALDISLRIGASPVNVALTRELLATALERNEDFVPAEAERRALVAHQQGLKQAGGPELAGALLDLAENLRKQRKLAHAEPLLREALEIERAGADDLRVASTLAKLGSDLIALQRANEAVPLLEECLHIRTARIPDDWKRYSAASLLGLAYHSSGQPELAEPLLVEGAEKIAPPANLIASRRTALQRVIAFYEATGRSEEAAHWRMVLIELDATR